MTDRTEAAARHVPSCPERPIDPDRMTPRAWRAWIDHLGRCERCRGDWVAEDPTRCFAWLADEPIPGDVLDAVSASVSGAVALDATPASVRARSTAIPATIAAGLLAAALTVGVSFSPDRPAPRLADRVPEVGEHGGRARADVALRESDDRVRMVDLTVGDRQVVMIFDERLQL